MKAFILTLMNSLLVLFTVLIHKIFYRVFLLNYDSLLLYWGIFVVIFFVLSFIINSLLLKIFIKNSDDING